MSLDTSCHAGHRRRLRAALPLAAQAALLVLFSLPRPASADVTVTVPDVTVGHGDTVTISVAMTDTALVGVTGVELWLATPAGVNGASWLNGVITAGTKTDGWASATNLSTGGAADTLRMALATASDTLSGSGTLLQVRIVAPDLRSPATVPIDIVHVRFNEGSPAAVPVSGSLTITGDDGSLLATPASIVLGSSVTVTVSDADENRDPGIQDSVRVQVVSGSDTETLWLPETGIDAGDFSASIATAFSNGATPGDGVLQAQAGYDLIFSFTDSLDSAGATVTRADTVIALGGTDGTVQTTARLQAADGRGGVRDTLRIEVIDADLDLDTGAVDTATVVIDNAVSGERETVAAPETGTSTGVFRARITTAEGTSGVDEDGVLTVAGDDSLIAAYDDAFTATGGTGTVRDTSWVVDVFADVTGNGEVSPLDASQILYLSIQPGDPDARTLRIADLDFSDDILAFDASLALEYVVYGISRFPVQTEIPSNHPFLKPATVPVLALRSDMGEDGLLHLSLWAEDRSQVCSGVARFDLTEGAEVAHVSLPEELSAAGYLLAHGVDDGRLAVAFAGPRTHLAGPGDVVTLVLRQGATAPPLTSLTVNGRLVPDAAWGTDTRPRDFTLLPNSPNPFNPETLIRFQVPGRTDLRIDIYDLTGQRIRSLVPWQSFEAGQYQVLWEGRDDAGRHAGSGAYLLLMRAPGMSHSRKVLLLR